MVKHDDYMTPFSAWEDVSPYIPRYLTLWEAFYGDGTSGDHLTELGFDVIHEDVDFFEHDLGECVVTNPPFSELPRVLTQAREDSGKLPDWWVGTTHSPRSYSKKSTSSWMTSNPRAVRWAPDVPSP